MSEEQIPKQLGLPLTRYNKRDIIRDAKLKTVQSVSAMLQKAVLKEMAEYENNHEGCFAAAKLIAKNVSCSISHVKNTWRVLAAQGFIHVIPRSRRGIRGSRSKHRPIQWENLALAANREGRSTANSKALSPRSTANSDADQRPMDARTTANGWTDQRLIVDHEDRTEEKKETTTEAVVVSSLVDELENLGVVQSNNALHLAREVLKLTDDEIRQRIKTFLDQPDEEQVPSHLYHWLTLPRSFEHRKRATQPSTLRGDAMTLEEIERERVRRRIVVGGRKAGVPEAEIEKRLREAGIAA